MNALGRLNWRESNAYLLLLSKYIHPNSVERSITGSWKDAWAAVLGASPEQVENQFLSEGMLEEADVHGKLAYKFKVSELKVMLKERGLAVSGNKDVLIERLVQADPNNLNDLVSDERILVCSEQGRILAEKFLLDEEEKRARMEETVLQYLKLGKFHDASMTVAAYEAEQVFSRGIGIDWKNNDPSRDELRLECIFGSTPKILSSLHKEQLDALRIAAGMISLLGVPNGARWLPSEFKTNLVMDNDSAIRMLSFYADHQAGIAGYRANSDVVTGVQIFPARNACDECKKLSGKKYTLDNVIEIPYEHCTHKFGCRCIFIPVVLGQSAF